MSGDASFSVSELPIMRLIVRADKGNFSGLYGERQISDSRN
jgi:hypothetical protein